MVYRGTERHCAMFVELQQPENVWHILLFLQLSSPFTPVFYSQLINYIMYGNARPYGIYNNKVLNDNFVSMTP